MAHSDHLDAAARDSIASQVARIATALTRLAPGGAGSVTEVAEGFTVWIMDSAILLRTRNVQTSVTNTNTWHHQIITSAVSPADASASRPVVTGYTRSEPTGPSEWRIVAVGEVLPGFNLPILIRRAAEWIEQNAPGDPVVRLVVIPERYMHCFWLRYDDGDKMLVIDMPTQFQHLERQKIYDVETFANLLALERNINGIPAS